MPEFVGEDAGAVVPFEDIDAMSLSIEAFYRDPERRLAAGKQARLRSQTDFSTDTACRAIFSVITSV